MKILILFLLFIIPFALTGEDKSQSLFDGKTLKGWSSKDGSTPGAGWIVEDSCIVRNEKAGDLYSKATFKDFEFTFEWKIFEACNSGVKYRVADYSGAVLGPEYQIIDDVGNRYKPDDLGATAAIYALKGASTCKIIKPVGEFNTSKIIAKGNHIEHWLNGKKVVEIVIGSDDWENRHSASKFKKRPDFGTKEGRIMLQDHGGKVWFRNLIIKKL
jgi:hypothetical protein